MTLYVGGTAVIDNINSPVSGKYSATFNFVEVTDILHDYELLTRGYIISGYKSSQCQDDVNKVIYATNTTTHLAATVTPGNYNGGVSGTQTAVAIAMHACKKTFSNNLIIETKGGKLKVNFYENRSNYSDVWLSGPCEFIFEGVINKKLLS